MGELEKQEIDKKTGAIIRYDENNHAFVSMPVSRVPFQLWKEWEADCKQNYGGNRWAKIYHDHQKVREFNLEMEMALLKEELNNALSKKENEGNPLGLLSGGDNGDNKGEKRTVD